MKPYYQDDYCTVYHGDCREILPEIIEVNFILTDPPYGIDVDTNYSKKPKGKIYQKVQGDSSEEAKKFFSLVEKSCKNFVVFGANNFVEILTKRYGWIVWDKRVVESADRMLGSPFELAITTNPKKYKIYRVQSGGVINPDSFKGNADPRYHPTQKPVVLFRNILLDFSKEQDLICDPFLGSGTTLIAAKQMRRKSVGVEINEEYCEISAKRLARGEDFQTIVVGREKCKNVFPGFGII